MTTLHQAAQMALDALIGVLDDAEKVLDLSVSGGVYEGLECKDAITALREALAAPMPEPVAWYLPSSDGDDSIFRDHRTVVACTGNKWEGFLPLYAAPPAAPAPVVPLTDEQILNIALKHWRYGDVPIAHRTFARAVLSAAPAVREPLSQHRVNELCAQLTMEPYQVRAIERAHGIGGATHD